MADTGEEKLRLRRLAKMLQDLGEGPDGSEVTLIVEDSKRPGMAFGHRGRVWIASRCLVSLREDASQWIDLRDVERVEIAGGLKARRDAVAASDLNARSQAGNNLEI